MPIPSRPRPDRRQMDGVDHPIALEADNALRRAPPRDRWDFPKNADANSSQPGTGRSGRAQGLSCRSSESRVFAFQTGSDVDRTVARALPLVRKTSGRIAGQSRARESETRLGRELIDYSEFSSKLIFTSYWSPLPSPSGNGSTPLNGFARAFTHSSRALFPYV